MTDVGKGDLVVGVPTKVKESSKSVDSAHSKE